MSYQVIARKYRPQRFSHVVGQEHVTQTLSRAIEQSRIAHAYLFCGPRGTGKTTIARIFAKCLNCTDGPKVDFTDSDPRCQEIAEGRSLDVLEIDGASNNGVEQVRELRETCKYAPASSRFKIYIIDEVHMLSTAAFNALLKTLEEPPGHVKFMFATTDPEEVLPTILSRCQRFDLRRIPVNLIAQHLAGIAAQEKVAVEPEALHAIARGAEGALRDAESTLDQLISFCGNRIEETDVLSMFGLTAHNQLVELSTSVLEGRLELALKRLNDLATNGKDLGRLVSDLLSHFRNLLLFQISAGGAGMLDVTEAESTALMKQSQMASVEGVSRIMEVFADTELRLPGATSKNILVEVALLKAIEARKAVNLDQVLSQLQLLRDGQTPQAVSTQAPRVAQTTPAQPARTPPNPPSSGSTLAGPGAAPSPVLREQPSKEAPLPTDLALLWDQLVEAVGRASAFTRTYLLEAHPVSFQKGVFTIGFDPEFEDHIGLVDNPRNQTLLQTKLGELGHPNSQFKFIRAEPPPAFRNRARSASTSAEVAPDTAAHPQPTVTKPSPKLTGSPGKEKVVPVPINKEDFKNDPLIQKALEIFKGQIVEVRA